MYKLSVKLLMAGLLCLWASGHAAAEENQELATRLAEILAENNTAEIKQMTSNFIAVNKDLPQSSVQTLWNAGVDSVDWDKTDVERLRYHIQHADAIVEKSNGYRQQYMFVFKHKNLDKVKAKKWIFSMGFTIRQLSEQTKLFAKQMNYLKRVLPKAIERTKKEQLNVQENGKNILALRLKAQMLYQQALNGEIKDSSS